MKIIILNLFICFLCFDLIARKVGETEITTEDGIEVFQDEKYYLLKKNVNIISDDFQLKGDKVKIYFEKDLYDIKKIDAIGNVKLNSNLNNMLGEGSNIIISVDKEEIQIIGGNSLLKTQNINMFSNGEIKVNNISGEFSIKGNNSSLKTEDIYIEGKNIDGVFSSNTDLKEIIFLNVIDEKIAYVNSQDTDMYANNINYNKKDSLILLENNVKIIRGSEEITGDIGTLDTMNKSYKVKSKNSNKVKVLISNNDE